MKTLSALVFGLILSLFAAPLAPAFAEDLRPVAARDGDGKGKGKGNKHHGKKNKHQGKKGHKKGKKHGKKGSKKNSK